MTTPTTGQIKLVEHKFPEQLRNSTKDPRRQGLAPRDATPAREACGISEPSCGISEACGTSEGICGKEGDKPKSPRLERGGSSGKPLSQVLQLLGDSSTYFPKLLQVLGVLSSANFPCGGTMLEKSTSSTWVSGSGGPARSIADEAVFPFVTATSSAPAAIPMRAVG